MKNKDAFTLIEMMIVVAIIIFLASIMVPRLFKYTNKAKEAEVAMMLASLHTAEQIYFAEHGTYNRNLIELDWKPEGNFYYTYGFFFPGAQEGINYFIGTLKTPPEKLGTCRANQKGFVARAAGTLGDKTNIWTIDETRKIQKKNSKRNT